MATDTNKKNIYCANSSQPYVLQIEYTVNSQSIANNTSNISFSSYLYGQYVGFNDGNAQTLTIYWHDSVKGTDTKIASKNLYKVGYSSGGPSTVYCTGSANISHSSDGTAKGYAWAQFTKHKWGSAWVPASGSVSTSAKNLPTIARASSIASITGANNFLGGKFTVNIDRKSSLFIHKVEYRFAEGPWHTVSSNAGTTAEFTLGINYSENIPDSTSGLLEVRVTTLNGSTQIGSATYGGKTLYVPDSVVPSIGSVTATRIDNGVPSTWNKYLRGISQVKIAMNNVSGAYRSTIKSYSISGHGISSSSNSVISPILSKAGSHTYTCTVTDSRGRSTSKTVSIIVTDYYSPSITLRADRCNSDGSLASDGTSLKIIADYSIASVDGKNSIKSKSVSCNGKTNTSFSDNTAFVLLANCAISNTYQVVATITDQLNKTISIAYDIPTAHRIINIKANKKGIAFGGFSKTDAFEVFMQTVFHKGIKAIGDIFTSDGYLSSTHAGGTIKIGSWNNSFTHYDTSTPNHWFNRPVRVQGDIYGGANYNRRVAYLDEIYPVGSIYISVNNVNPKSLFGGTWERFANGRTLVGVDESDADFNKSLKTGGEKKHTLTVDEMPSHSHGFKQYNLSGTEKRWAAQSSVNINVKDTDALITNTGGGQPHNNLQPYISVYMWKRTA